MVTDVTLSDHYCVFFEMTISPDTRKIQTGVIRKQCMNENRAYSLSTAAFNFCLVDSFSSDVMKIMDARTQVAKNKFPGSL